MCILWEREQAMNNFVIEQIERLIDQPDESELQGDDFKAGYMAGYKMAMLGLLDHYAQLFNDDEADK
jgi:hypothetical protein